MCCIKLRRGKKKVMRYALAIDIGGTFTDSVLHRSDGVTWTDKTLSTHDDLLRGFFTAANLVLNRANIEMEQVDDVIVHATTIVTNVLIERKGFTTGLITTEGFKDVLYIRDEHRYDMFDPQIEYPEPLIKRDFTFGVNERTFADGTIGKRIDCSEVERIVAKIRAKSVISVAVCLLNSYANPQNEKQIKEILEKSLPDLHVTLSSDISPEMREYRRTTTAAVNAYAMPITQPYLESLIQELKRLGVSQEPLIMLSNGGLIGASIAGSSPVRMIESGPAAGALVSGFLAKKYEIENIISFDMGGTTAKACIIQGGEPTVIGDFEVDRRYQFKPGSGMTVTVPSIDMIEIGAGGGSIARVDALGLLKVGPDSAGSAPGPACYDRGGTAACVTDADVVLGILDPANFLGGDMRLDKEKSVKAIQALADVLHVSVEDSAWGIFSVVGESMAAAARAHATDRGIAYRGLPLLAFGGAGPVHACYVAERLESRMVIYPPLASVLSAYGTLVTPVRLDLVRGGLMQLEHIDWNRVDNFLNSMLNEGKNAVKQAGISESNIRFTFAADMRYRGQQDDITVSLAEDPREQKDVFALRQRFDKVYETVFGGCLSDMHVEITCWRLTVLTENSSRAASYKPSEWPGQAKSERMVFLDGEEITVPIYSRVELAPGQKIQGPVIIEERETTCFVLPAWEVSVQGDGTLIAEQF